jgi:hypothetical protein
MVNNLPRLDIRLAAAGSDIPYKQIRTENDDAAFPS